MPEVQGVTRGSQAQSDDTRLRRVYEVAPLPDGEWFSLGAVCLMFGVSRRRLYNILWERRDELSPPTYRIGVGGRLYRLLSADDYALLRPCFRVRIWRRLYR